MKRIALVNLSDVQGLSAVEMAGIVGGLEGQFPNTYPRPPIGSLPASTCSARSILRNRGRGCKVFTPAPYIPPLH